MKGLSELIAVILIIAIAVLATSVIYNWFSSYSKDNTYVISNRSDDVVQCGVLDIDDVYISGNVSRVIVRSVSSVDTIISASFLSSSGQAAPNITQLPINIGKGQIKFIEFNLTGVINSCANFSQATVSTKCIISKFDKVPKGC